MGSRRPAQAELALLPRGWHITQPPPPAAQRNFPTPAACSFTAWVYPLIVAVLLWGPQDRCVWAPAATWHTDNEACLCIMLTALAVVAAACANMAAPSYSFPPLRPPGPASLLTASMPPACLLVCRDHNFALNAFWAWWWPGVSIVYPFLGRVWCSVCPFMITGELVQRWRIRQVGTASSECGWTANASAAVRSLPCPTRLLVLTTPQCTSPRPPRHLPAQPRRRAAQVAA